MSVLSEEEIEKLKETHPVKKIFRYIFLFGGLGLIALGLVFLLIGVDFGATVDDINISFVIDILIIIIGMILASKFWVAPYYLRENSITYMRMRDLREPVKNHVKFNSFALSRLLAAIYFVTVGFWSFTVFGTGVGHHETRYGNAFVLGGPSFFYFTGLPALVIGFSLLLYIALSTFRGTFSESENFYFFYENRPYCPWLTEVPKKDIEAIRYQNNHLGPKLTWILLLFPFIVMQLMTSVPLYFNNPRQGPEYVFSNTLTIISIIEIIALIILVFFPQNYFEIGTEEMLYEMWFAPIRLRNQPKQTEELADFFNCGVEKEQTEREVESSSMEEKQKVSGASDMPFPEVSRTHFQLFDTIFGLFLIISAIVMLTQMVLFGPLFWWVALMYGFMLIVKAFNYDFSRKKGDKYAFNMAKNTFKFERRFSYKFHYLTAYKVQSATHRKWFRKLDFFDIFGLGGMLIMLVLQQTEGWAIADSDIVITANIMSTIYMAIVLIFILLYLCLPIDVVEFKTPSITYRIRVTEKLQEGSLLSKWIHNLKAFPKEVLQEDMKKTFFLRLGIYLILILGTLFVTVGLLISYFY
ncbi:MAG: hypothetical protein EU548_03235 [Promethearchaeota archaeon]|nr:MAG: hypothetical protein EU548_03235 [Candidatus Lokiarchaeota archaeon]